MDFRERLKNTSPENRGSWIDGVRDLAYTVHEHYMTADQAHVVGKTSAINAFSRMHDLDETDSAYAHVPVQA